MAKKTPPPELQESHAGEPPLTAGALREFLAACPPEARIYLQGCDCINPASKAWIGKPSAYEDYQGQIMLGFGPRDSYLTRPWQEAWPDPEPPPEPGVRAKTRRQALTRLEQAAPPAVPGPDRNWATTALSGLTAARHALRRVQDAAPLPAGGPPFMAYPPGQPPPEVLPELAHAAGQLKELKQQLERRFAESLRLTGQLPRPAPATPEETEILEEITNTLKALNKADQSAN